MDSIFEKMAPIFQSLGHDDPINNSSRLNTGNIELNLMNGIYDPVNFIYIQTNNSGMVEKTWMPKENNNLQ